MTIRNILTMQYYDGIPIVGLENVRKALQLFGTKNTWDQRVEDPPAEAFVTHFMKEASRHIARTGEWQMRFPATGTWPFVDTYVGIRYIIKEQDLYLLNIHRGRTEGPDEEVLCEQLGLPGGRALDLSEVMVEVEPMNGPQVQIDFEPVAKALNDVFQSLQIDGNQIANWFADDNPYSRYEVYQDNDIAVGIHLEDLEPVAEETWGFQADGNTLHAFCNSSATAKVFIGIIKNRDTVARDSGVEGIWEADIKERVLKLTKEIEEACRRHLTTN